MNYKCFLSATLFLIISSISFSQNLPEKPNKLVNDYTNTLSIDEANQLEQKLVAFDDSTSTQIAVVLIQSLDGYEISDYSVKLFEKWGIGQSKKNNGILLLLSLDDRKVWITTGYGVEGALPDAIAKRIIENEIIPDFKTGNYYSGINAGTNAIISYTKGEYKSDNHKEKTGNGFVLSIIGIIVGVLVIVFIIITIIVIIFIIFGKGGGRNRVLLEVVVVAAAEAAAGVSVDLAAAQPAAAELAEAGSFNLKNHLLNSALKI